jgi:succinate-semialdehyde dehydrogenase/glutarate-semialdehyde dehydrogenase
MSVQTTNPSTNKVVKSFDEMTDEKLKSQSNSKYLSLKVEEKFLQRSVKVLHKVGLVT